MMRCPRSARTAGQVLLFFGALCLFGCSSGSPSSSPQAKTLASIAVIPANPSIAKGKTEQYAATGTYSDGSTQNLTSQAIWTSSNAAIATISTAGLATAVAAGSATIEASLSGVNGSTGLTVIAPTLQSIAVTPANPSIAKGMTEQYTATGTYSDGSKQNLTSQATWTSSNTSIATVSTTGLATAAATGSTKIQAFLGGLNGSTALTVTAAGATLQSIAVTPANPSITAGNSLQFTATGTFGDGSTSNITSSVTWASSNAAAATITSAGLATAVTAGQSTTILATQGAISSSTTLAVTTTSNGFAGVFTQHNDNARTGQNLNETALTLSNVNASSFGKLFSQPVDGFIFAQPLYVPNVAIAGKGTHNVLIVATENDSVYAFDADNKTGANANPLWQASLVDTAHGATAGETALNESTTIGCGLVAPKVGVTSTPVIDASRGTVYVEAKSVNGSTFIHRLHALDVATGSEKSPGPSPITATIMNATGDGSDPNTHTLTFDSLHQLNRPGLLMMNGTIFIGFASHCDFSPFHGWLFAYDATTLVQKSAFVTTPNGSDGGFWMSGAGLAADINGNIYVGSGNGTFNQGSDLELGDSILKFDFNNGTFSLLDYFAPSNQESLDVNDNDLGSGGVLLLPDQPGSHPHVLTEADKAGRIYLVDRDQMTTNNIHYCASCSSQDTEIVEESTSGQVDSMYGTPAYWNSNLYFWGSGDTLKSIPLSNGKLDFTHITSSTASYPYPGATPSISANGTSNGIVWSIDTSQNGTSNGGPAILHAHDATNVANELWNSSQAANNRDTAGHAVRFAVPTIANGKVYVGTQTELDVYGLLGLNPQ